MSLGFTKATAAAGFWILNLQPTVQETKENQNRGPGAGCTQYGFEDLQFSYPLAPDTRVLKGLSLQVSNMRAVVDGIHC